MMEAITCRDGIQFAKEKGVERLPVETDCQELIKLSALGSNQRSYIMPIIRDITELSLGFLEFSLLFAPRSCNRVAHVLAKQVSEVRLGEWHITPTCIDHLVTEECNPVNP